MRSESANHADVTRGVVDAVHDEGVVDSLDLDLYVIDLATGKPFNLATLAAVEALPTEHPDAVAVQRAVGRLFKTVKETLARYFADRQVGSFSMHSIDIG